MPQEPFNLEFPQGRTLDCAECLLEEARKIIAEQQMTQPPYGFTQVRKTVLRLCWQLHLEARPENAIRNDVQSSRPDGFYLLCGEGE